jgi:hypothetical protein
MAAWYRAARTASWSTRAVIAAGVLAVLLVAAVPAAFVAGLILMLLGHVVVGASVLAAVAAVVFAGASGLQHLRKLVNRQAASMGYPVPGQRQEQDQDPVQDIRVVQLGRDEYDYR